MKAHIGVDSRTKIIHSVAVSAANVHDSLALPVLLHGKETRVWGDRRCRYKGRVDEVQKRKNRVKSSIRSRVEHPFLILKKVCGFEKVRYRGMAKNSERVHVACALINLFQLRGPLSRASAACDTCR